MLKIDTTTFRALPQRLQQAMQAVPEARRLVVALSGGVDSMVLFYVALAYADHAGIPLIALHVNHGLSPKSDDWQKHCQQACKAQGVTCLVEKVQVTPAGEGIEAAARRARYQAFEQTLISGDVLLQGHHQNDVAETVLMRMLRGAGPEGLSAIPAQREVGAGILYRPFLHLRREHLLELAQQHGWQWVEDESNQDLSFDRNYIRHKILPVIEERWSMVFDSLSQVSQRAMQAQYLIESWCKEQSEYLRSATYSAYQALDLKALARFDSVQQRALVRYWLDQKQVSHPGAQIFERIWTEMIPAAADAQPMIQWGIHQIRRYDQALFYTCDAATKPWQINQTVQVDTKGLPVDLDLNGWGVLRIVYVPAGQPIPNEGLIVRAPDTAITLGLQSREGGEKIRLNGINMSLKRVFQNEGIPPWERDRQLLLYFDEALVAVSSGLVADAWRPQFGQAVWVFLPGFNPA
ncbi:MAG: tRNA lysidine(34) synthetase TilS [Oleiphilaceae bacterium]|nr:tRNA lysidine(34) synthetase TilS [Oleiphilaceae bacterium]